MFNHKVVVVAAGNRHAQVTEDGEFVLLSISENCKLVNKLWYAKLKPLVEAGMKVVFHH